MDIVIVVYMVLKVQVFIKDKSNVFQLVKMSNVTSY